jgi:cytochrome c553
MAQAAGDAAAGKEKSAVCAACHGADGNSLSPIWPKLAGQHPFFIEKQLHAFKSGERKDPLMSPMALPLTDQDIQDLAAYFSSQKQTVGQANADQVKLGERIYRAGNPITGAAPCMGCHGPKGLGNPAGGFPRIGGQHAGYTEKALKDFRGMKRTEDDAKTKMMTGVAAKLTDAEITAVTQYMQGLH